MKYCVVLTMSRDTCKMPQWIFTKLKHNHFHHNEYIPFDYLRFSVLSVLSHGILLMKVCIFNHVSRKLQNALTDLYES